MNAKAGDDGAGKSPEMIAASPLPPLEKTVAVSSVARAAEL